MGVGDRGVGDARAGEPGDVTGDQPDQGAAVVGGEQAQRVPCDRLVARRRHLERRGQVDPQLHGVGGAAAAVHLLRRQLVVEDAAAGGHPLGVALGDHTAAAVGVVVGDLAVEDVGHGLETAMRMPRRPLGFVRRVDLRAEVVEEQERICLGHRQLAGEGTSDAEPGALGGAVRRNDPGDGPSPRRGGIGSGDAGQDERVVHGDGRHGDQLLSGANTRILMTCLQ